jgi:hypothetical protein
MLQSKKNMKQRNVLNNASLQNQNLMLNCGSGGALEHDLSFIAAMRHGFSNEGTGSLGPGLIPGYNDLTTAQFCTELEDNSNDSILNSHRRSRSQSNPNSNSL